MITLELTNQIIRDKEEIDFVKNFFVPNDLICQF